MASSRSFPALRARFGRFQLDLNSRELLCSGTRVPIQDKPLQILRLLLEAEGQVVSREQIRAALWPEDTFVDFEHGVNTAVKKLRQALEDSAENPEYIETLPRVGYRFLVPVEWEEAEKTFRNSPSVVTMPAPAFVPAAQQAGTHQAGPHLVEPEPARPRRRMAAAVAAIAVVGSVVGLAIGARHVSWNPMAILTRWAARSNHQGSLPAVQRRRLTANPDDTPVTSAAISPDGKYLAYTDSTGFYLRLVDTGETHPVPVPAGFVPSVESWFPDSVHLVVSWMKDETYRPSLWAISVLGGTPRKLSDVGSSGRVSPDGTQISFLKGPWDANEIWLVDPSGNGARKIVEGGRDFFGPASWSADGKRLAYVHGSGERAESQIETYDLARGRSQTVLSLAGLGLEVSWTHSGRLFYSVGESAPNREDCNVWSVEIDSRTGRSSSAPLRITDDRDCVASMTTTSDGKRLAVVRHRDQADVYLSSIEGRGKKLSPPRQFTLDQRQDFPSSWTPDSKTVLVVSNRDGVSHIFKQKIDQTQAELFVGGKQDVWLPHMTPDGSEMLYLASPEQVGPSDKVRLMSIPLSGGPSRVVLEEAGIVNYQCARLPSRACVYAKVESELYKFFRFDASKGNRTELPIKMTKAAALNTWNLSPDGKFLAISDTRNPYEGPKLRIISVADATERLLTPSNPKLIIGVDWAADSKSLWLGGYMGRGAWGTRTGLVNMDLNGRATTFLEGRTPIIWGGTPSPDGYSLALGANTLSSNVWLLENP
jgi:Tol biopolymer transport system component/DNA-binding winged helix-turn-helix (wHTH) protein